MSTLVAYAVSFLLNLGIISPAEVNRTANSIRVIERDGKTIIIDSISGTEVILTV